MEKSGLYRHPVPNDVGSSKSAKPPFHIIVETPQNQFFEKVIFQIMRFTIEIWIGDSNACLEDPKYMFIEFVIGRLSIQLAAHVFRIMNMRRL